MEKLHRSQILLEPSQRQSLAAIARRTGRSVSGVIRDIIRQHLAAHSDETRKQERLAALAALERVRQTVQAHHGVLSRDLLAEARAEEDANTERVLRGQG